MSCFKTVPSLEDLEDMTEQNPHGNGFSIRTKENKIEFFKGRNLSPEKILEIIKNYGFNQGDSVEFVFHARITSHGSTCNELECDFENPNKKDDAFALMTARGLVMRYLVIECEALAHFLNEIENKNMKTNFKKIELYYSVVELCRKFYGEEQEEFFDNQTRDE